MFAPLILAGLGCSSGVKPPTDPQPTTLAPLEPQVAVDQVALLSFTGTDACSGLEQHLEDRAVLQMRISVALNKHWALSSWDWYHSDGGYYWSGGSIDAGASGAGGGSASMSGGPSAYTTTNVQVPGVDEPDFVKNDGTRLFVLSGRELETVSTWPAEALALRGKVAIEGVPAQMFLEGNTVVVFSRVLEAHFGLPSYCASIDCSTWYSNATQVTSIDVSDLSAPRITARQLLPGTYDDARRVGTTVRVITRSTIGVDWYDTYVPWDQQMAAPSPEALGALYDALADSVETKIRARTLEQWIGTPGVRGSDTRWLPLACEDIVSTNASSRLGLTNIITLDLSDPSAITRQALLADVDQVYQSSGSLYLAQRQWWWDSTIAQHDLTYLYRFDVTQPTRASFLAAGRFDGTVLDQYSLDEQREVLRVAATERDLKTWQPTNRVLTLHTVGQRLVELGRTPDLAPGQSIMSARFMGDVGYVVTYRQVDPLFALDLHDDAAPTIKGALEVPGFSTYLHPLDATHLLSIGVYTPENASWMERALQLAIFDVSDLSNPRQTFTQKVGSAYGWSDAQWDHHAFNYFPERKLLAIPFYDWFQDTSSSDAGTQWNYTYTYTSDLRVYGVDAETGFTAKGALDMRDVLERQDCGTYGCWDWYWYPMVRRSVMADDSVYAISSGGVRVARVGALSEPLATVRFTPAP